MCHVGGEGRLYLGMEAAPVGLGQVGEEDPQGVDPVRMMKKQTWASFPSWFLRASSVSRIIFQRRQRKRLLPWLEEKCWMISFSLLMALPERHSSSTFFFSWAMFSLGTLVSLSRSTSWWRWVNRLSQ